MAKLLSRFVFYSVLLLVLLWFWFGLSAKGNAGHTLVMVAINSLIMLLLFGVIWCFLLGVGQLPVPWQAYYFPSVFMSPYL